MQLRRITSTGRFVPEIDGLRCIAIISVVLYHLGGFLGWRVAEYGYRGVNLFYVISGFILGLPFAVQHLQQESPVKLKSYFLRRLTRLEPPYLLSLLICFIGLVWLEGRDGRGLLPPLAASAGYVHSLWFGAQSPINPVTWSLEVEVQFYCLAPVLALVFALRPQRLRRAVLLALVILAGIVQLYFWDASFRLKFSILFAIQFFLAGFLLADVYLVDWKEKPARSWRWDLAALPGWPLLFTLSDTQVWVAFPILAFALYVAAFRSVVMNWVFETPRLPPSEACVTRSICFTTS
jgi:peptidoglycan/LPS O-acetylase OafA/YrhL